MTNTGLGSPISGLIGIVTSLGGLDRGWFLKKSRNKKNDNLNDRYKEYNEGWEIDTTYDFLVDSGVNGSAEKLLAIISS